MKKFLPSILILSVLFLLSGFRHNTVAQTLLTENFDYSNGTLLTTAGWTAHSGSGTQAVDVIVPGLSFSGYPLSGIGGAAQLDNNGEDVNKTFAVQTSGKIYAAFMMKVNAAVDGYFLHLGGDPVSTIFRGKVFTSGTSDPINFGMSVGSNTATTIPGGAFQIGKTYLFILKYEVVDGEKNDVVSLYIISGEIPATEPATPTLGPLTDASQSDITPGSIALRQYNAAQNIQIDGIRIAKTWAEAVTASGASDKNPPVFAAGYPKITNITSTTAELQMVLDEPGKVFFVVQAGGSVAPTAQEVFSGITSAGSIAGGQSDIASGGAVFKHTLQNLKDKTHYDAYFIAQDDEATPNKQATPVLINFYTEKPRDVLYSAGFDTSLAPFTQVSTSGDQNWSRAEFGGNGYAYINGYSGGNKENVDWLISPAINLDSANSVRVSFASAMKYTGPAIKVMISGNFSGSYTSGAIAAATWTDITSKFSYSTGNFTWVPSGDYDFTSLSGKVYIAFRYESTTDAAAAWEIDDFSVTGYVKTSGINAFDNGSILLYPVPAGNEIHFSNLKGVSHIEVADITGKLQISENWNGASAGTMNISRLGNGVYFIRFVRTGDPVVVKFIKQ